MRCTGVINSDSSFLVLCAACCCCSIAVIVESAALQPPHPPLAKQRALYLNKLSEARPVVVLTENNDRAVVVGHVRVVLSQAVSLHTHTHESCESYESSSARVRVHYWRLIHGSH